MHWRVDSGKSRTKLECPKADASTQIDLRSEKENKQDNRQHELLYQSLAQENEQTKNMMKTKIKDLEAEVLLKLNKAERVERPFNRVRQQTTHGLFEATVSLRRLPK